MSISTYAELVDAVARRLNRAEMNALIPEYIAIGETKINRRIDALDSEVAATATLPSGDRALALPTNFKEMIDFWFEATGERLSQVDFSDLERRNVVAKPYRFAVGSQIEFDTVADAPYLMGMRYNTRALNIASTSTNWLLTAHPDVYLYASLAEASIDTPDDDRRAIWTQLFAQACDEVNQITADTRGKSTLKTEAPTSWWYHTYDIYNRY